MKYKLFIPFEALQQIRLTNEDRETQLTQIFMTATQQSIDIVIICKKFSLHIILYSRILWSSPLI